MKPALGLVLGACLAVVIGCAAAPSRATAPPATSQGATGTAEDPHAEIARLDRAIDAELAQRGLPPAAAPACTGASCAPTAAEPMATTSSAAEATTCRPGPSDTCKDSCTLSDSICSNAARICDLARQLGGGDAYANETCAKGRASCETSRRRCCGCQL